MGARRGSGNIPIKIYNSNIIKYSATSFAIKAAAHFMQSLRFCIFHGLGGLPILIRLLCNILIVN